MTLHKIILGVGVVLLVVGLLYFATSNMLKKTITPPSSIVPTTLVDTVAPSQKPAGSGFTGAAKITSAPDEKQATNEAFDLETKLPVITSDFKITYDYDKGKYIVTLTQQTEENKNQFNSWLQSNYPHIPTNQFILK